MKKNCIFFILSIIVTSVFSQKKHITIDSIIVYYIQENIFPSEPKIIEDFTMDSPYVHRYLDEKFKKGFYNDLNSYIINSNSIAKNKNKYFDPDFLIEYYYENDTTKFFLIFNRFGYAKSSFYNPKDSVMLTGMYLINLLENKVKGFKKMRAKYNQ